MSKKLDFIRGLACLVCGDDSSMTKREAAHIRFADARAAKPITGMGTKSGDYWTVPLCMDCHRLAPDAQHTRGESEWWAGRPFDVIFVAMALDRVKGDHEAGCRIIERARQ